MSNMIRVVKHSLIILTGAICLSSCGGGKIKQTKHKVNKDCVYVCSGKNSKRYHSVDDCKGLSRCGGEILEMTIDEAEGHGRTPCRMCVKK